MIRDCKIRTEMGTDGSAIFGYGTEIWKVIGYAAGSVEELCNGAD
jgi:hypothetical protein